MEKIEVVLAEDHQLVRQGLRLLIDSMDDIEVVGEASDGKEALRLIVELKPQVAVFDITMPVMNGIELVKHMRQQASATRMLALTANEDRAYMSQLVQMGVRGYLLKRSAADDLILAIRTVARGEQYLDPSIVNTLVQGLFAMEPSKPIAAIGLLTDREEEVMKLLARGFTNNEVAGQLEISIKTVETHKARAMLKMGLRSRAEIVRLAISLGWMNEG